VDQTGYSTFKFVFTKKVLHHYMVLLFVCLMKV
jgi:hypothetical protein